ncbi:hypothetical protein CTI12_AA002500 [Artemisia annua]|uniref:Uncharacterized protein n=1 Tax=Artemisia annua TaxID=35608 RepID=A0A2U1QPC8_ARTAN|nr:hypothetical protein CTI12_AA002500 [Artemisia annua]
MRGCRRRGQRLRLRQSEGCARPLHLLYSKKAVCLNKLGDRQSQGFATNKVHMPGNTNVKSEAGITRHTPHSANYALSPRELSLQLYEVLQITGIGSNRKQTENLHISGRFP